jgi:SAM-dependent methyltransferase
MERDELAVRDRVRQRYAAAAVAVTTGPVENRDVVANDCCGPHGCSSAATAEAGFGSELYSPAELDALPSDAVTASLGCGNPLAVAELREGETVLDLGSGGGIDVLLSARRVGPSGKAYGLDMTEEMLALALANQEQAGVANVEFLKGHIEDIPVPASTIDVIISNCVINLSTDKPAVFAEAFRVLRPGGRLGVTDVVAEDDLSPADRARRGSYVGCIAGACPWPSTAAGSRPPGSTKSPSPRPTRWPTGCTRPSSGLSNRTGASGPQLSSPRRVPSGTPRAAVSRVRRKAVLGDVAIP